MNKVVLITGASSGMGEAAAKLFANKGWQVVAGARRVENIPVDNNIFAMKLDVTSSESNQNFVKKAIDEFGRIDVLINNAGYGEYGPTEEIQIETAKYQFDVNYFAAVELSNLVLPIMRQQRSGRIINVSSIGGDLYMPLGAHYHASKAALQKWSDVLDLEVRQFGIRSLVIQPGGTQTSWQKIAYEQTDKNTKNDSPYKKLVDTISATTQSANITASADDLANLFYKSATDQHPKRRYYNSVTDRLLAFSGRVLPGIVGTVTALYINKELDKLD